MAERDPGSDEHRYRMLVEAITDYAIYMLNVDGRVTSWNPGAQRFKGYTSSEIIGEHFSRFYTAEDQARGAPAKALASAATDGRYEAEGWRVRKDGARFWAHVVIDPIRDPAGELIGYAKITRDLTERMETQEALRASQEQLRVLVQGVTDYAIYMLDPRGNVVNWNAGAERIKGYRPSEIIGQHFSRFYTAEDQQAQAPAKALATAESEGRFEKEGWRVRKDGSRFWAHVIIDPIRNDDGELIGFAKVTRDITERLKSDQALAEAQQALLQAQKMEAIGQLTGGVAHDFNNLLAAILGSLELVRKRMPYDPRITPLLENAIQGAERGAALTERMLAFARKQELQYEAVDVAVLVRGMLDFMQRTIGGGVEVNLKFPSQVPRVLTDPFQLEAAILNLAVNARDAMVNGGKITISAEARHVATRTTDLGAGNFVVLRVTDTGEGMTPETLAKAAEPFFTTKGVGKGTGLGLSMVHGLAAQSGGKVAIESSPGKGTSVEIWLPVTAEASVADIPQESADAPERSPAQGRSILVVDDDNLVLVNTAAMLEDLGHQVVAASSGAEAVTILGEQTGFDLLITDELMPGMTGSQLAVAALDIRPELPVLLATGFADTGHAVAPLKIDLPRLSKPFTQVQLAEAVDAVLTRPA